MRFKFFGTEIYISFLFAALITFMLACDKTGLALPMLFAVIMHEIGHLFAMWMLDCTPKSIRLIPASVQITKSISKPYRNDITVALFGPLSNLVLFFALYCNFLVFKSQITLCYALINLLVALFNLLPVTGLDGGTVLYSVIAKRKGPDKASLTLKIITSVLAVAVFITAVTLTVRGKLNLSLYIIAVYLFTGVVTKL